MTPKSTWCGNCELDLSGKELNGLHTGSPCVELRAVNSWGVGAPIPHLLTARHSTHGEPVRRLRITGSCLVLVVDRYIGGHSVDVSVDNRTIIGR